MIVKKPEKSLNSRMDAYNKRISVPIPSGCPLYGSCKALSVARFGWEYLLYEPNYHLCYNVKPMLAMFIAVVENSYCLCNESLGENFAGNF